MRKARNINAMLRGTITVALVNLFVALATAHAVTIEEIGETAHELFPNGCITMITQGLCNVFCAHPDGSGSGHIGCNFWVCWQSGGGPNPADGCPCNIDVSADGHCTGKCMGENVNEPNCLPELTGLDQTGGYGYNLYN